MSIFTPSTISYATYGNFFLALSIVICFIHTIFALSANFFKHNKVIRWLPTLSLINLICLIISCLILISRTLLNDFSFKIIYESSTITQSTFYKIAGLWSTNQGSFLLWCLIFSFFQYLYNLLQKQEKDSIKWYNISILSGITTSFNIFCFLIANPFLKLFPPPADGIGMNPLLQDPIIFLHPILLYSGNALLGIIFVRALVTLIQRHQPNLWTYKLMPWLLLSWIFLTSGIVTGSWWACHTLGWSGYWFWDPVENLSLLPWLSSTALLHCFFINKKSNHLTRWSLFFSIYSFCFAIMSIILPRTSFFSSLHSFSNSSFSFIPTIIFLISFILIPTLIFLSNIKYFPCSSPSLKVSFLMMICFLMLILIITTGIFYPIILKNITNYIISVGPPYYNLSTIPIFILLIFFIGRRIIQQWKLYFITSFIVAFTIVYLYLSKNIIVVFSLIGSFLIILQGFQTLYLIIKKEKREKFRCVAKILTHTGLAISIIGMCALTTAKHEKFSLSLGETKTILKDNVTFLKLKSWQDHNKVVTEAKVRLEKPNQETLMIYPQTYLYKDNQYLYRPIISHHIFYNTSLVIIPNSENTSKNPSLSFSFYYDPLEDWLWLGASFMILGAIIFLFLSLSIYHKEHHKLKNIY